MKKVRILSIDGGGIRGIIPGLILSRLEEKLQKESGKADAKLADYFDFMAGTSTGAILVLYYLVPGEGGKPKFTADEAVKIYLERGDTIFDVNIWQAITSFKGVSDEKYDARELEKALDDTFKELKLSELIKPCIISSYDIKNGKPHFFKQHRSTNDIYNFRVKDIARATSAAPTYFECALIKNEIGTSYPLIDGGVFVNNPSLVSYSEARTMTFGDIKNPTAKDMMIVSLGTGSTPKRFEYKKAKDWGPVSWIKPSLDIMMDGNSQTVDHHLCQIYDTLKEEADRKNYHRLTPNRLTADPAMDNASKENMSLLKEDALSYISDSEIDEELDAIAKKLVEYGE
ncbi:patatin-like phospholipase family protein [Mangrovivirga sp. M17]|uniref:Patatin-like phospholipase family protein n=1 Tax=Mangrovivirga halotolerans TaxID=2993936 RepID=A0ABT3RPD4_9BACT|nr:patatin-like phospholipase family protein [Mangrovivirga halotolerans]MCX2743644.1 patatin-like phospholipase family protein [Mangrovivirga halotolerans]